MIQKVTKLEKIPDEVEAKSIIPERKSYIFWFCINLSPCHFLIIAI